jgi:hypothetical protein
MCSCPQGVKSHGSDAFPLAERQPSARGAHPRRCKRDTGPSRTRHPRTSTRLGVAREANPPRLLSGDRLGIGGGDRREGSPHRDRHLRMRGHVGHDDRAGRRPIAARDLHANWRGRAAYCHSGLPGSLGPKPDAPDRPAALRAGLHRPDRLHGPWPTARPSWRSVSPAGS